MILDGLSEERWIELLDLKKRMIGLNTLIG